MSKYVKVNSQGNPLGTTFERKVDSLIKDGAIVLEPKHFEPNLVCVIDFGMFAGAAYAETDEDFKWFNRPGVKKRVWLKYTHAARLAQ